ncbi:hypothetical protein HDA40_001766 [Hamadaea flava]|uniref:HTH merR-type domain-containing protein n=1 Tax=Hamadaea flava TaxID=1742688 RepID=A0ABV8LMH0_9ACTN|nr:hypothetical protein [Hamadaea flava]
MRDLGVGVDEIALQLDDMVNVATAHVANDDLPTADLELLRSVIAKVDEYDRTRPNFLSEAGLQLPEWAQVRQLAADVMSALQVSWDIDADAE